MYIKDTKPTVIPPPPPDTSDMTGAAQITTPQAPPTPNLNQNIVTVKANAQQLEQLPFYTLQLPATAIVANSNVKNSNLNTINLATLQKLQQNIPKLQQNEVLSNVVVNSNGEVINIGQVVDFDQVALATQHSTTHQQQITKTTKSKKSKYSDEPIIKIDLTDSDTNQEITNYDTGQRKYDKLPHIKANKYAYNVKLEEKQTQQQPPPPTTTTTTVIYNPISEYNNQNYTSFPNNTLYTQQTSLNVVPNSNLINSNIVCSNNGQNNTTDNSSTVNINVLNQPTMPELQPSPAIQNNFRPNNYTNVISTVSQQVNVQQPTVTMATEVKQQNVAVNETTQQQTNNNNNNNNNVKQHICDICMKSFKRREHLYQHVKLHTGFRPYICEQCNKAFMRKEHLLRHMTLHSGQKNFTCNICEKSFSRNDNLLKHKKTHEKQSSYTCEICQKQFVMKHYYIAHKMTHTNNNNSGNGGNSSEKMMVNHVWGLLKT